MQVQLLRFHMQEKNITLSYVVAVLQAFKNSYAKLSVPALTGLKGLTVSPNHNLKQQKLSQNSKEQK